MRSCFLKCTSAAVLVTTAVPIEGFVLPLRRPAGLAAVARTSTSSLAGGPSAAQQEQLDKYGPTPETCMEMLFEKLMDDDKDFYEATGADDHAKEQWQTFLSNLKTAQGGGEEVDDANSLSPKDVAAMFFSEASKS